MNKFLVGLLVFCLLLLLGEGVYYFRLTKTLPWQKTPLQFVKVKVGEYVTVENLANYKSADEKSYRGYIIPGRTFKIVEQKGEWLKISVWEEKFNISWEGWIKVADRKAFKPK